MGHAQITFAGAFVAGLLSFLSPCVLPLIPSYITYITGLSFADLQAERTTRQVRNKAMLHSLAFIAGFTVIFVLLGASATAIGTFLQEQMGLIRKGGGVLIVLFGMHIAGIFDITMLLGERRINLRNKPAGFLGSFLVGLVFAAGWTPCIGPILASILMVAATEETVYQGIALLLVYSLGLGIPFFLSAVALHRFLVFFNRYRRYIRLMEIITGIFLMIVGVLIFTNSLSRLSMLVTTVFGGI
jgi:cytochrome c-type biogenesis protein